MTVVNLSTVGPALGHPENVPIDGAATAVAWVGDAPYSYLDGAEVVMPAPLVVRIDDGVPDQPFDIPPDGGQYCWRIEVETWNPGHSIVRYVTVPASGPVDFEDLADVNRYSFDPEAEPEAAWWTAVNPFITAYNAGELTGDTGPEGPSAYDVAVANGFVGTEAAWLLSLEGADGEDGADGTDGAEAPGVFSDREQTMAQHAAWSSVSPSTGTMDLAYFTARYSGTRSQVAAYTATSASAALTLAKMGIYSVDGSGNLTLIASTANETSAFAASGTRYLLDLLASVALVKGQRYAIGHLIVGTTMGNRAGMAFPTSALGGAFGPVNRPSARLTGQTDLPGSVAVGSLANTTGVMYLEAV